MKRANPQIFDELLKLGSLLITGMTGSGKSIKLLSEVSLEIEHCLQSESGNFVPLLLVIDEYSDLICDWQHGNEVESHLRKLARYGQDLRIFTAISTSRPGPDVFTDSIKMSFNALIVGKTFHKDDSFTLLKNDAAFYLHQPGEFILRSPDRQQKLQILPCSEREIISQIQGDCTELVPMSEQPTLVFQDLTQVFPNKPELFIKISVHVNFGNVATGFFLKFDPTVPFRRKARKSHQRII